MTVYRFKLLLVLVLFGACCAHRRHTENETVRKLRIFESKLQKLETEIQAYPSTNSTSDRLERLEVLVNLLSEDVYNVRVDQELLKRDIMERLREIEDKISEIRPPVGPSGWIQFMMADHYKDFRPVRNYTDDDMPKVHSDCKDAYDKGWTNSGVYRISLNNGNEIDVFCDQESSNGGWIVIQRRVDGSINFGRTWADYRDGFGDVSGEFWIGNQNLRTITAGQDTRLRIELQYLTDGFTEVQYQEFWVEGERDLYRLHISGFDGSDAAGDSFSYHDGMYFSAVDSDYDHSFTNCALRHGGGWWYNDCTKANLNGVYTSQVENGMFWRTWTGYSNTLKSVTMMVRGSDSEVNGTFTDGDLRLINPNGSLTEGRLEMVLNDTWGSICDDSFDDIDALVACRQLGFLNGTYQTTKLPGTGPIWLDELRCSSYHKRLLDCPHSGIGNHNCGHYEDVYITCHNNLEVNGSHTEGDLRLVNPNGIEMEGRLEIYLDATWGSICDDNFDNIDAMVACKQLGHDNGTYQTTKIPGTGPIWLDDLGCSPHHTRLLDCPHRGIGNHNCNHNEDTYIACHDNLEVNGSHTEGDLRLVNPNGIEMEGRLEIYLDATWGSICDDNFDNIDAMVACKQLGHDNGTYQTTKIPGTGPIWLDDLGCSPHHARLLDCPHRGIGNHNCNHNEDTYIACHDNLEVNGSHTEGDLRLVNPNGIEMEGRLEIYLDATWGSICDDNFDNIDAMVACKQLGHDNGTYQTTKIPGTGPIWLDDLGCSPHHTRLLDCPHRGIGNHNCNHNEDIYIACHDNLEVNGSHTEGDLRLVNPNGIEMEGRLEIYLNATWGTICDDNFDNIDAMVACKQLGHDNGTYQTTKIPGTGPIWLDDLGCSPHHTRLLDCPHRGVGNHNCNHNEDTYIACYGDVSSGNCSELRLVHPVGCRTEGRLEIKLNDTWGTICDDYFYDNEALVACRQLGFTNGEYLATALPGRDPIWLDDLHCRSSDRCLEDCLHNGVGDHNCLHSEDVYIACYDGSSREDCPGGYSVGDGNLRLVNPNGCKTEGRLEMLWKEKWGTVCNKNFDDIAATVACKQIGFTHGVKIEGQSSGSSDIWLDDVRCTVNDTSLMDCAHRPVGNHSCGHQQDVHIACFDDYRRQCTEEPHLDDPIKGNLRLIGALNQNEGRLEIFRDNSWGTVCEDGFGNEEATVVCREMGYHSGEPMKSPSPGTGSMWKLSCSLNHRSIEDCTTTHIEGTTCTHEQDAGVVCFNKP